MQRINIVAEVNSYTGYGLHLQELVKQLENRGYFCTIRPLSVSEPSWARIPASFKAKCVQTVQPEDWELFLCPPHNVPTPGKKVIYYTMWETDRLPEHSVKLLNKAEAVIVPCRWCEETFKSSGVKVPIYIVPLGIDPEIFKYQPPVKGERTIFGTAGRMAHGPIRKGIAGVIKCFQEAFRHGEKVELQVKVQPDCELTVPEDSRIKLIKAHWTNQQVADWLHSLTCFVSGATGEGWGLWQHQALACGVPLIACRYGGIADFYCAQGRAVDYTILPAQEGFTGNWSEPDWCSMIFGMRWAIRNLSPIEIIARTVERFTWNRSAVGVLSVLVKSKLVAPSWNNTLDEKPIYATERIHFPEQRFPSWQEQLKANGWTGGRIEIPVKENEVAFNPGLQRIGNGYNLYARHGVVSAKGDVEQNHIKLWKLDNQMKPIIGTTLYLGPGEAEDARVVSSEPTFLSFSYVDPITINRRAAKYPSQRIAELGENNWIIEPKIGQNGQPAKMEKNWLWFSHQHKWHVVYHIEPHTVYLVGPGGVVDQPYMTVQNLSHWKWGRPLGGTPPIRIGDEYWAFFHSRLPWKLDRARYFSGAYAFEARPPFRITRFAKEPFLIGCPNDLEQPMPLPHCLIYPTGAVYESIGYTNIITGESPKPYAKWRIVAGVNDQECIWVDIPHKDLENRMIPIL